MRHNHIQRTDSIGQSKAKTQKCGTLRSLRGRFQGLAGLFFLALMGFQAWNQPASLSAPADASPTILASHERPGFTADWVDDVIDIINDIINAGGGTDERDAGAASAGGTKP